MVSTLPEMLYVTWAPHLLEETVPAAMAGTVLCSIMASMMIKIPMNLILLLKRCISVS